MSNDIEQGRRIERLEEKLGVAQTSIAELSVQLNSTNTNLTNRMSDMHANLKETTTKNHEDFKNAMAISKVDNKADINDLRRDIKALSKGLDETKKAVNQLYVAAEGSRTTIKTNEKVIWGIIGVIGSIGVYLIKTFFKSNGGG